MAQTVKASESQAATHEFNEIHTNGFNMVPGEARAVKEIGDLSMTISSSPSSSSSLMTSSKARDARPSTSGTRVLERSGLVSLPRLGLEGAELPYVLPSSGVTGLTLCESE